MTDLIPIEARSGFGPGSMTATAPRVEKPHFPSYHAPPAKSGPAGAAPSEPEFEGLHPVDFMQTKGRDQHRAGQLADLERRYGFAMAAHDHMMRDALSTQRRLGGLPSTHSMFEVMSGGVETLSVQDMYGDVRDSVKPQPHPWDIAKAQIESRPVWV
eukprot:TRINITY_DN22563_c0_g1_i1.p1 TRINITY_DN22563_c0_g1~~TRINITY_DN22563_c0_g1_i1.p1  ORF type:complete len:157 (-),score=15.77 TRINITY_DN22563_c0_g1_i1:370-840(-)